MSNYCRIYTFAIISRTTTRIWTISPALPSKICEHPAYSASPLPCASWQVCSASTLLPLPVNFQKQSPRLRQLLISKWKMIRLALRRWWVQIFPVLTDRLNELDTQISDHYSFFRSYPFPTQAFYYFLTSLSPPRLPLSCNWNGLKCLNVLQSYLSRFELLYSKITCAAVGYLRWSFSILPPTSWVLFLPGQIQSETCCGSWSHELVLQSWAIW